MLITKNTKNKTKTTNQQISSLPKKQEPKTRSDILLQDYFLPAFFAQAVPQYFALASKVVKAFLHT
jgi:hypothetical protein